MIARFLSRLLWLANARMQRCSLRFEAYQVKDRILRRHGHLVGHDIQHIVKRCYDCGGAGEYEDGCRCYRCSGTGVFDEFWVRLERWEFAGRIFHRPIDRMSRPRFRDGRPVIEGRIAHAHVADGAGDEAILWLLLFYDRRAWRRLMRSSVRWTERVGPMLWLQWAWWKARMYANRLRPRSCHHCGRSFVRPFKWQGSYFLCFACADMRARGPLVDADDDLPF
jgi:hypothetical protein